MHIAIVGSGRLGRAIAFALLNEWYVDALSLVDIAPGVAWASAEELKHAAAAMGRDLEIRHYENCAGVEGADIVVVTAGKPRTADMTRRDLAAVNGKVIASIARSIYPNNESARFVIVTNPVDAMATLFWKITGAEFVISTGTQLDSVRFRSELAKQLKVPRSAVEAYVAGEHGPNSVFLWSMTRVCGMPVHEYLDKHGVKIDREDIERAVRSVAREVIARVGATIYGPAATFREIIRSIALNESRVMTIAAPTQLMGSNYEVCVSVPRRVGRALGPPIVSEVCRNEYEGLLRAAASVHDTFIEAARTAGLTL